VEATGKEQGGAGGRWGGSREARRRASLPGGVRWVDWEGGRVAESGQRKEQGLSPRHHHRGAPGGALLRCRMRWG
jgi:hypothetical protein